MSKFDEEHPMAGTSRAKSNSPTADAHAHAPHFLTTPALTAAIFHNSNSYASNIHRRVPHHHGQAAAAHATASPSVNAAPQHQPQPQQQHLDAHASHRSPSSAGAHVSPTSAPGEEPPTLAASTPPGPSKNTRIPRACDLCSTRKVKCEGGPPPCRPCRELGVACTYERVKKRRGPPNRAVAAAKQAEKRRGLQANDSSELPNAHQNVAHARVSVDASSTATSLDAEQCIAPLGVLKLLVDDFFTYVHPLVPFPHEPTFRAAFEQREDQTNPEFLALLAGMIAALVSSFPRSARLHLKASQSHAKFPRAIILIDRCMEVALAMRNPETMLKERVTVGDAAISYFMCLASAYTMRWNQARRFLGESLRFLCEMGFYRKRPPPISLSVSDATDLQSANFIHDEIGKRIYWTVFLGVRSMTQIGASPRDLIIPPATSADPYPDWPLEVDDACILPDRILPQPAGTLSIMTGFVRCIQVYQTMEEFVRMGLSHGISTYSWEQQKRCLHEAVIKLKAVEKRLPPELRLDMSSRVPSEPAHAMSDQDGLSATLAYQYVPAAYPNSQPAHDVRYLFAADENKKRLVQFEIQKANIYASLMSTRSHFVELYLSLRDVHLKARRAEHVRSCAPAENMMHGACADMSSSCLAAAAIQAVSERKNDTIDQMFAAERDEVIHDFFTVLMSIDQRNMEPNGMSLIGKIRQVAGTLLGDPGDRKEPREMRNEQYLRAFLEILTRLEKTGTAQTSSQTSTKGDHGCDTMTQEDEEQELSNWVDLREQQQWLARTGLGF